jgi:hypothetical protein
MKSILAWIFFVPSTAVTIAFHLFPTSSRLSLLARFVTSDFEGIIGESYGDNGGRKLAQEFDREVKARRQQQQQQVAEKDGESSSSSSNRRLLLSQDELRIIHQRAFSNRRSGRQAVEGKDAMSTSSSAGFFTRRGQSVYSFPLDNPRGGGQQQYSLASNNNNTNNTPVLPILVALALLSIYMAVGLTGDVSETMQDWNAIGDVVSENVERVVPSAEGSALERVGPNVYL